MDIELLIKEVNDPIIRENFRRIKARLLEISDQIDDTTTGTGGGSTSVTFSSTWKKATAAVSGSSTIVIDTTALADFSSLKYILSFNNDIEEVTKKYELSIVRKGSTISDSIYARLGSALNLAINSNINGSNLELEIINNETFDLSISYAKLVL